MEGIIELQRRAHEAVDILEQAIVDAMVEQPRTHKGRLMQEHYVSALLDHITENSAALLRLYADEAARADEIGRLTAGAADAGGFYEQLQAVKERHRRLATSIEDVVETEALKASARPTEESFAALFSGDEVYGRFLDLQEPYGQFINLPGVKKTDYLRYLDELDSFAAIPLAVKSTAAYASYLTALHAYLESFFRRAMPLYDHRAPLGEQLAAFEDAWAAAQVGGWESLALNERPALYCGPCEKQFYNEAVYTAHLAGKKHTKAAAGYTEAAGRGEGGKWAKETARRETVIAAHLRVLAKIREETKGHIEAKQSRSAEERALDLEREEELAAQPASAAADAADDEEMDPKIYNPLNLPLDWDGKPIPYWLWKLHGLGTRYPCEICGSHVYMGRKAFDQHFYEWRHSHGLKCLGIPNTRHFFQVTSIKDAVSLWDKLKVQAKEENFRPEVMEEFEDQHGNVYNRKTFEDLKRQGLL